MDIKDIQMRERVAGALYRQLQLLEERSRNELCGMELAACSEAMVNIAIKLCDLC